MTSTVKSVFLQKNYESEKLIKKPIVKRLLLPQ